jgi:hypothetical protein
MKRIIWLTAGMLVFGLMILLADDRPTLTKDEAQTLTILSQRIRLDQQDIAIAQSEQDKEVARINAEHPGWQLDNSGQFVKIPKAPEPKKP